MKSKASDLLPLYKTIQNLLNDNDFLKVTEIVDEYIQKDDMVLWVGLPRLTFVWRKSLPKWDSWVADSIKKFDESGENGRKIMRGLY
jgi:hypothetical protein